MSQQLRSLSVRLTAEAEAVAASTNHEAVGTSILGSIVAAARWKDVDRANGDELYDVRIEHSPDPFDVADADAMWFTLITFAQATGPITETLNSTTPHFSRMRAVSTLAGTTPSAKLDVIVEGVQF